MKKTDHKNEIIKLIKEVAYSRDIYQVFSDFLEMSAIAISNTSDFINYESREKRYLEIIRLYDKKHQQIFPLMLFHLIEALEEKVQTVGPEDVLGVIFNELELHNKYKSQSFTPQPLSDIISSMTFGEGGQSKIEERGFINVLEPTVGSGVMVTSFCKTMKKKGLNYCSQLVVTAVDCDLKCTHMAYLQFSLYGIPAVVIHGDSLTCEEWSRWYTPVYMADGWIWRNRCNLTNELKINSTPALDMIQENALPRAGSIKPIKKEDSIHLSLFE